jgi:hypothetical protein
MTATSAKSYDYGYADKFSGVFKNIKIPSFIEFIDYCKKYGLHPYINLKGALNLAAINTLMGAVTQYGMRKNVTWLSTSIDRLNDVKSLDPDARLGYTVTSITPTVITTVNSLKTDANDVFINSSSYTTDEVILCKDAMIPLEIYVIDFTYQVDMMDLYISGVTSNFIQAGKYLMSKDLDYLTI